MAAGTEEQKAAAARAAVTYVEPGMTIGVGSGTTVAYFIDALAEAAIRPLVAVSTSADTSARLGRAGIAEVSLAEAGLLALCVDGTDEIDPLGRLVKGAGGAHTREKSVAAAADVLVIIADGSKLVAALGERAAVPLEALAEAVPAVLARLEEMGARVTRRSDPSALGNVLLDAHGLDLSDPAAMEAALDAIPGVVECGIFALRGADVALVGTPSGTVRTLVFGNTR